jgi:hypothetical protein
MSDPIRTRPRKGETVETIAESIGRIRVIKISSPNGSRLVITMSLEDDKLAEKPKQ